jgi:hypothetical protein
MCAVQGEGSTEMVKLLLGKDANATATDKVPHFCIVLAHFCKLIQSAVLAFTLPCHLSRSHLYYKNCANFWYFVAQNGETVFMIAALAGASKETMQLLLDCNCNIDVLDRDDKSVRDMCKAAGVYYNRLIKCTTNVWIVLDATVFAGGSLKTWALTVGTFLGRYKRDEVSLTCSLDLFIRNPPMHSSAAYPGLGTACS